MHNDFETQITCEEFYGEEPTTEDYEGYYE